ncbi:MAG: nucleotidyltransferase family protein [Microbacterium sp.]
MHLLGLVLAAGEGRRYGGPKGLGRTADGTAWVQLAAQTLRAGGCDEVVVLVGARGDEVAALVPADALVVEVPDWSEGLAATLRAGLGAAGDAGADAVVVLPVDMPDAPAAVVARVLAIAADDDGALVQAVYRGVPGHPVVIGRRHFPALAPALVGDRGAREYLVRSGAVEVECSDLWDGHDIDRPADA